MSDNQNNALLLPREAAQLFAPGRHLTFTKDPRDLTKKYTQEDISIRITDPPKLNQSMFQI